MYHVPCGTRALINTLLIILLYQGLGEKFKANLPHMVARTPTHSLTPAPVQISKWQANRPEAAPGRAIQEDQGQVMVSEIALHCSIGELRKRGRLKKRAQQTLVVDIPDFICTSYCVSKALIVVEQDHIQRKAAYRPTKIKIQIQSNFTRGISQARNSVKLYGNAQ